MAESLAEVPDGAKCTECGREVAPDAAFSSEDKLYCGSCAPPGSVPARVELAQPSAIGPVVARKDLDKVATIKDFVFDLLGIKKP